MKNIALYITLIMMSTLVDWVKGADGYRPKMNENNQSTVSVKQSSESLGNVYTERGSWTWAGNRNKVYAQLEVSVPKVALTLFNETYSVGGEDVCIRVQLVDDNYFAKKSTWARWVCDESEIKIRKSDYDEIMRNGKSATFKSEDDLWKTLHHEAIHASFSHKYSSLRNKDSGLDSFLTEMLAYVGGTGLDERSAAAHIAKFYPKAKAFAEKYLAEFDKAQCECSKKVLQPNNPVSVDDLKSMNLDDPDGDWCQCANPGCVNTFHLVNGKHDGYLTFECSKCKKVNVGFAKEAIRYAQILKSEGTQPKWFGQNAEARANAAGMSK